jgi:predicted metal-binding membrane protein
MTVVTTRATAAVVLASVLGVAALCWVVALGQMDGMDMGVETELGSFGFFIGAWAAMMAAMMLPGVLPAALRQRRLHEAPLFAVSYVAVWTALGIAVYALYEPHSHAAAAALVVAAGIYELTPFKRECRRRCRAEVQSGLRFGLYCAGSSIGLMAMFVALGVMNVAWMSVVALLVLAQKLIPPIARVDVPVALAIVALGIGIAL